jgi:hypothetical protein
MGFHRFARSRSIAMVDGVENAPVMILTALRPTFDEINASPLLSQ